MISAQTERLFRTFLDAPGSERLLQQMFLGIHYSNRSSFAGRAFEELSIHQYQLDNREYQIVPPTETLQLFSKTTGIPAIITPTSPGIPGISLPDGMKIKVEKDRNNITELLECKLGSHLRTSQLNYLRRRSVLEENLRLKTIDGPERLGFLLNDLVPSIPPLPTFVPSGFRLRVLTPNLSPITEDFIRDHLDSPRRQSTRINITQTDFTSLEFSNFFTLLEYTLRQVMLSTNREQFLVTNY